MPARARTPSSTRLVRAATAPRDHLCRPGSWRSRGPHRLHAALHAACCSTPHDSSAVGGRSGPHRRVPPAVPAVCRVARPAAARTSRLPRRLLDGGARRRAGAAGAAWLVGCRARHHAHGARRLPLRDLDVTAFNGRLFAPDTRRSPSAPRVDDGATRARHCGAHDRRPSAAGRRVALPYGELGVEQLGAIYERLIDQPDAGRATRPARRNELRAQGHRAPSTRRRRSPHFRRAPHAGAAGGGRRARRRSCAARARSRPWAAARSSSRACRYLAAAYERALIGAGAAASRRRQRGRTGALPPNDCATLPVWRGQQPDGRAAGAPLAVAHDAGARSPAHLPRPPAAGGRQPRRRQPRRPRATARGPGPPSPRAVAAAPARLARPVAFAA